MLLYVSNRTSCSVGYADNDGPVHQFQSSFCFDLQAYEEFGTIVCGGRDMIAVECREENTHTPYDQTDDVFETVRKVTTTLD